MYSMKIWKILSVLVCYEKNVKTQEAFYYYRLISIFLGVLFLAFYVVAPLSITF